MLEIQHRGRLAATNQAEDTVRRFYDEYGWREQDGVKGEDRLFRNFSGAYRAYHEESTRRTLARIGHGQRLLIVGCGDMPESHVRAAAQFSEVTCLDISGRALDIAQAKLGPEHHYLLGSIIDTRLPPARYDTVLCSHVLYHLDRNLQARAVCNMLDTMKPDGRTLIIYANPRSLLKNIAAVVRRLTGSVQPQRRATDAPELYYHAHPRSFWRRFRTICQTRTIPWEAIGSCEDRTLLRHDAIAAPFYRCASWIETHAPWITGMMWKYYIAELRSKPIVPRDK
ncbi:MAG: class I SAM-dependent methyltransferase [Geminicoccaceae bacterium]|nr:class I SAM-dependent methyltransferase [Geminicoccaceae bacterium]